MSTPAPSVDENASPADSVLKRPESPANLPPVAGNCPNCGAAMVGEFCFRCGQPKKGLIRHFSSIIGDFLDSVLNLDNRTFRTVGPLFFKPGYLTNQYLNGRRAHYVTPLRLYFFLSVIAFILIGAYSGDDWAVDDNGVRITETNGDNGHTQAAELAALSPEAREARLAEIAKTFDFAPAARDEVIRDLRREIDEELAAAKDGAPDQAATKAAAERAADKAATKAAAAQAAAGERASARDAADATPAASEPEADDDRVVTIGTDASDDGKPPRVSFNGKPWDAKTNPLNFGWLPKFANDALNEEVGRIVLKVGDIKKDPKPFVRQMFSSAPQALFVILPLFALMLKVFYLFKRRLYMEHLIVALHSHSFLCLALILIVGTQMIRDRLGTGFWYGTLGWMVGLLWAWMPIYLLVMQKRVYRQGWIMTSLKYFVIGCSYLVLLAFGMMLTMLISLVVL